MVLLFDQVMGMMISVIEEKVITGALKWAAGLAAFPLGTIIEGAIAIWNLVSFIREQYNRMVAFFTRIYDMIGEMVAGNIDGERKSTVSSCVEIRKINT